MSGSTYSVSDLPPLLVDGRPLPAEAANEMVESIDPLALNEEIIEYTDAYIDAGMPALQKAQTLHTILRSRAFLGLDYDNSETYTAVEAFRMRRANCVGYANLYIALARHYGLKANYQMVEQFPEWGRLGDVLAVTIHVNSLVELPAGYHLMVDIGGNTARPYREPRVIDDARAKALFYNNLAMKAFVNGDTETAYGLIARAIALAPDLGLLWSNLGAIFRNNQQLEEAESIYRVALEVDDTLYTVFNNLAILYDQTGRYEARDRALAQIKTVRERNPYYHYALAVQSVEADDYAGAHKHLLRAMSLKSDEPTFRTLLDLIDHQLMPSPAASS